ncbi:MULTISPECIES: RNA 2',3'-cyclic phosphodiesterase [Planococcus]|uniref:RNA 2',3'-cyclic phosphodiesterase n=1 Tax=Planococcus faecalis TaxID=1598147 RepID=A0ABM6IQQ8_9BACL|nr:MULTISPECIES: RNA 2',3'-cyclic phosphodiesterase [Planococcus]AQU78914.1 2'-5' RNA ligase [Planococcus faecalis]MDJ0330853.1 RNA 2',3'-cyclic phosphodiesterase [Planococcus sp. S3-L1]OHX51352.1 2'-5' RNA ligase [Planococcus faecalis]
MKPHYFVGIKIPQNIAENLVAERDSWKLKSHKRQTPAQDMHITLLFIGEDVNGEIDQIEKLLARTNQQPFKLTVNGIKTFGNPVTPRIIYASLESCEELNVLQRQIVHTLDSLQMSPNLKEFVPHITLASKWAGGVPAEPQFSIDQMQFEVTEFSLFRIAMKEIPRYQKIFDYRL